MCNNNTANLHLNLENAKQKINGRPTLTTKQWAKYISSNIATSLATANEDSKLLKSYWNSYHCNQVIRFDETAKGTSSYCKNRWCYTCSRIRTAVLIKGYLSQLQEFENSQFVTLTRKTCTEKELPKRIEEMQKTFSQINDLARKNKYLKSVKGTSFEYKGLRKLEVTTRPGDKYHAHFHLIVNTKEVAEFIVNEWLKHNKDADIKAQDIRQADDKAHKELFKYFTKLTESKRKPGEPMQMNYKRLDVIFVAMKGKQVFKSFGSLRMVKEDFEDEDLHATTQLNDEYSNRLFDWIDEDWIDKNTGEMLIGKDIPTKVKNLLPVKAEEKKAIEQTNYLPPLTTFASLNDAFDFEEIPINYYTKEPMKPEPMKPKTIENTQLAMTLS